MTVLSVAQAQAYATAAGFSGQALAVIVAIAQAESGLDTTAHNINSDSHTFPDGHVGPSTDRGILQINNYWHPEYSDAQCDDPATAFQAGYTISHSGTKFTPWSTYQSGAYLKFLSTGGNPVSSLPTDIPRNPAPLSQLHEPTKDGQPDENTSDNCGETVAAWIVRDIGTEPDCDGDEIHDAVIGQGVTGGSDLLNPQDSAQLNPKYVAALATRGVALTLYRGTQAQLAAKCHAVMNLAAGDVLANFGGGANYLHQFSDPVHYSGFGHICAVAHSVAGGLELMDPWIGAYRTYTDAQLEAMIVWGYVVVATPAPVAAPASAPTGGVPVTTAGSPTPFFGLVYTADAEVWHCPATGFNVGHGFLNFYQGVKGPNGQSATQILGLPKSGEYPVGALMKQDYERGRLVYDESKADPWQITLDSDFDTNAAALKTAQDAASTAQAAAQSAQQKAVSALAQAAAADNQAQELQTQLGDANQTIADLQAQIKQLQSQPAPTPPVPTPAPVANPAPTTIPEAAALLVTLITAEVAATIKAATPAA